MTDEQHTTESAEANDRWLDTYMAVFAAEKESKREDTLERERREDFRSYALIAHLWGVAGWIHFGWGAAILSAVMGCLAFCMRTRADSRNPKGKS